MTPTTTTPAGVMERLRETTAERHRALEDWIDIDRRFSSLAGYQKYLLELLPLFRGYEDGLAPLPWAELGLDFDARRKAGFVERDLRFFGLSVDREAKSEFPTPPSLAAGLGALYVLEGSTLGGRFILERLRKQGLEPESGAAFFHCYGDRTQEMWREFKRAASDYCPDEERIAEACAAAAEAFDHYRREISPLD